MPWEKRYFAGGDKGYENTETKSIVYSTHRNKGWDVVLNGKTIARDLTIEEVDALYKSLWM